MIKLYLADFNYNIICPLDLSNGGVTSLNLIKEVGTARILDIQFNVFLNQEYDYLLTPEACLVLEIDDQKIGFSKDNNFITHLCPYAEVGGGSEFESIITLDSTFNGQIDYPISSDFLVDYVSQDRANYVLNKKLIEKLKKSYYYIKPFSSSNKQENQDSFEKEDITKEKLYSEVLNFFEAKKSISIDKQIKRQNGVVDLTFYSSSFNLNKSKRLLPLNQEYSGNVSNLLNVLDEKTSFKVLDNIKININTGAYSNFELLNKIVENRSLSWREIGLINENNQIKTLIEIGDFDKTLPKYLATNIENDDWFDNNQIRIKSVKESYPSISVDLDVNKFILEGDNIQVLFKEHIELIDGTKKEIFNIDKVQNYKKGEVNLLSLCQK